MSFSDSFDDDKGPAKALVIEDPKALIDLKLYEFTESKTHLNQLIKFIDFIELKVEIIEEKKKELHREFNTKTQDFHDKRADVDFSGASPSQISFQLNLIERDIANLRNVFDDDILSKNNEKLDLIATLEGLAVTLEEEFNKLKGKFDEIVEATGALSPEVVQEYASNLEQLQADIENFQELQSGGWTNRNIYEKLDAYLNNSGLKRDEDGFLITLDQKERIGFIEAEKRGLFTEIDERIASLQSLVPRQDSSLSLRSATSSPTDITITPSSLFSDVTEADMYYLREAVGTPLTIALAEITAKQPRDPIHYLAHFLFKYRYNAEMSRLQQKEIDQLNAEREVVFKARWQKFILDEARKLLTDLLDRVEYEIYLKDLERLQLLAMEEENDVEEG